MNEKDLRVIKTRESIEQAFLALLAKKPLGKISIVELAREAREAAEEERKVKEAMKASLEATEKKAAEDLKKAKEKARADRETLLAKIKETEDKVAAAGAEEKAEAEKLRAETEALRKQLAMSGTETVIFKLRFSAWQEAYRLMAEAFTAIQDEETKAKLRTAIKAQVEAWGYGNEGG